jgi:hypothetical protein
MPKKISILFTLRVLSKQLTVSGPLFPAAPRTKCGFALHDPFHAGIAFGTAVYNRAFLPPARLLDPDRRVGKLPGNGGDLFFG